MERSIALIAFFLISIISFSAKPNPSDQKKTYKMNNQESVKKSADSLQGFVVHIQGPGNSVQITKDLSKSKSDIDTASNKLDIKGENNSVNLIQDGKGQKVEVVQSGKGNQINIIQSNR